MGEGVDGWGEGGMGVEDAGRGRGGDGILCVEKVGGECLGTRSGVWGDLFGVGG